MKYERQIVFLAAFAVVLAITFGIGVLTTPDARSSRSDRRLAVATFERSQVETIAIDATSTTLVRVGEGWGVGLSAELSVPARTERVDALLDGLTTARVRRVVTTNRARHAALGFGAQLPVEMRVEVRDAAGVALLALEIGEAASDGSGVYARVVGSEQILEIDGTIAFYLDRDAGYWVDRRLMPGGLDAARTVWIGYSRGAQRVVLRKSADMGAGSAAVWHLESDSVEPTAEVDASAVLAFVRTVIGMEAELLRRAGAIDPRRAAGDEAWSIELRSDDGRVASLRGVEGSAPLSAAGTHIVWSSEVGDDYQLELRADQVALLLPAPQRFLRRD